MSVESYESLKSTPDALISLLVSKDDQLQAIEKEAKNRISSLEQEIDKLHHLLIKAKKNLFGKKSEKLSGSEQQELFSFTAPVAEEEALVSVEPVTEVKGHLRKTRTKRELPDTLPRERIEYDLDDPHCQGCGKEMAVIGEELSEELEFIPAQLKVIEHARLKRACSCCKSGVFVPALPPEVKPLERRKPGAGLLAQILVSKYQDHQPLYRQEQIFARNGIILPRKLLCDWVAGTVELLRPIYEELKRDILKESYLQADETHIKVQDPELKDKLHQGYLWAILGPPNRVLFHYAESRAGEVPRELLKGFKGYLQTDAYAAYNAVFLPDSCRRIACMAHIRRKFIEAQASSKSAAGRVLMLIAELYKLERSLKDLCPLERCARRKKKAFPIIRKLYRLLRQQRRETLPQSIYMKALNYAWEQRIPMLRYLRDGRHEIDNNLIENQMRPVALGRKNYLFAGSHQGAERAAILYSLLNTCKLNKLNSWQWLSDVIRRVHTPGVSASELLPHNWVQPNTRE